MGLLAISSHDIVFESCMGPRKRVPRTCSILVFRKLCNCILLFPEFISSRWHLKCIVMQIRPQPSLPQVKFQQGICALGATVYGSTGQCYVTFIQCCDIVVLCKLQNEFTKSHTCTKCSRYAPYCKYHKTPTLSRLPCILDPCIPFFWWCITVRACQSSNSLI